MLRLSFEVTFGKERREASEGLFVGNIVGKTVNSIARAILLWVHEHVQLIDEQRHWVAQIKPDNDITLTAYITFAPEVELNRPFTTDSSLFHFHKPLLLCSKATTKNSRQKIKF